MLTSPLSQLSGWAWAHATATDLPKQLQQAFPPTAPGVRTAGMPVAPVSAPAGVAGEGLVPAMLRYPATGRWHHARVPTTTAHWVWGGAADILRFGGLRTRLSIGNPLFALRFDAPSVDGSTDTGKAGGVVQGAVVAIDGQEISVGSVLVLAFAPGAPGLDTLAILRRVSAALDAEAVSVGSPSWQEFVSALDGLEEPLRIVEPGGSPATGRTVGIVGGGSAQLTEAHNGDALAALGLTRAELAAGAVLDVGGGGDVIAAVEDAAFPDGRIPVAAATSAISVAAIEDWLAPQQADRLERFTRKNTVTPFADGASTFADLFAQLDGAVEAGPEGAFYVTGYSLKHDAKLVPASVTSLRTVEAVARAMAANNGQARFLALQMLQLDPAWVRDAETAAAIVALLISGAGTVGAVLQDDASWDQMNFFLYAQVLAGLLMVGAFSLESLLEKLEQNAAAIDALAAIADVEAHLDPVDAEVADNPRAQPGNELIALALEAQRKFSVYHQKIQIVRNRREIHAYCGGIDLNGNRTQTPDHASRSPFHDVHARVDGLAAGELAKTFSERWDAVAQTSLAIDVDAVLDGLPQEGADLVQVARTYYRPDPASTRGFPSAPTGERTILDTLLQAIGRARRSIYIEDQYLTPPPEFSTALVDAAERVAGPLIIIVPATPDQPFGLSRRLEFIQELGQAWGDRLRVGTLRKRFSHASTSRTSASGRLRLASPLTPLATTVDVSPARRVPTPPFWMVVGGEVMRAKRVVPADGDPVMVRLEVERGNSTNLFKAGGGTTEAEHTGAATHGAPVVCGAFSDIYVHSKMMLIDDAFASIGSANLNRRGFYSDGECNIFALRETVAAGSDNWIRKLRIDLWCEHLGVPAEYGVVALRDPTSGLALFDRRFTVGNRFSPFEAQPYSTDFMLSTEFVESTGTIGGLANILKLTAGMGVALLGSQNAAVFDTAIDPSSGLE